MRLRKKTMLKNCVWTIFLGIMLFFLCECKTPYTPAPVLTTHNYLVVEGLINITDSTYIKLSRTVNVSNASTLNAELKATITIESNNGSTYPLSELGNGNYGAAPLNLSSANQYRLRIKTSNGEQYLSDFGDTKVSPPIDSISFQATTNLKIYANTHDPNNNSRYYRWDFTEEWIFHSSYNSQWITNGLTVVNRTSAQQIWECYTGDASSNITLGTSTQLSSDVINQQLITTIPSDAEKISLRYSILVKQYVLTKDAYDFWTLLKKNTEQLGSIFDSQPSASIGNIHCLTVPTEPVIGYVSAGTISTRRIFISKSQLPNWVTTVYGNCADQEGLILKYDPSPKDPPWQDEYLNPLAKKFLGPEFLLIPVSSVSNPVDPSGAITGWLSAAPICVDCTLRGTLIKPSYWQ